MIESIEIGKWISPLLNYKLMRKIVLLIYCLILFSCQNSEHKELITISVNVLKDDFSSIKNKIIIKKIIQLDDSIPIGKIRKAIVHKSNLYIHNKSKDEILCFNEKGELVYSIFSKGRGPEEYVSIMNFFIDFINNELIVLSSDNKILRYSCNSGALLNILNIENKAMILDGIQLSKDVTAWYTMGPEYNLTISNKGVSKQFIPFIEARDMTFSERAFSAREGNVLFVHGTCDYIYKVDKDTVNRLYYIDFGNYKIPIELYKNSSEAMAIYEKQDVATKLDYIVENDGYISFSYLLFQKASYNVINQYSVYSKIDKKCYNFHSDTYLFPIYDCTDESFISLISPTAISAVKESDIDSKIVEFVENNNISEDANPMMVFWRLDY